MVTQSAADEKTEKMKKALHFPGGYGIIIHALSGVNRMISVFA